MELSANCEPVHHFTFDRFDHAVGASGGDPKSGSNLIDGHVMAAADADLAIPIKHDRPMNH